MTETTNKQTENKNEQETLLSAVENYEPKKRTHNIADLDSFSLTEPTALRTDKNKQNEEYSYKVLIRDGKEYRIPWNVLEDMKELRKSNPNLKAFKVLKSGSGLDTRYRTIPHVSGV